MRGRPSLHKTPSERQLQSFDYAHGRRFGTGAYGCRCDARRWDCGADREPIPRNKLELWECPTAPGVSGPDGATLATSEQLSRPSMFRVSPDIDRQGFLEDVFMIWNMKRWLPPQAEARQWFERCHECHETPRLLDNGGEQLEATAQAKYASCRWSLALSERRLRRMTVECSLQR
jgi:hypothetical protein